MSYIIEHGDFRDRKIDLPRFAADLAKALDRLLTSVEVKLLTSDKPTDDNQWPMERQIIRVGADHVSLSANTWKKRICASIAAPDVSWDDRNTYASDHRTEDATVNPEGRKIEAIARDINRRVIEASQPALKLQREHAANMKARRVSIVAEADALRAKLPALCIRTHEKEQYATIYGGNGHYLSGRLDPGGNVSLDRIGSMSVATFERIVAILNDKGNA